MTGASWLATVTARQRRVCPSPSERLVCSSCWTPIATVRTRLPELPISCIRSVAFHVGYIRHSGIHSKETPGWPSAHHPVREIFAGGLRGCRSASPGLRVSLA